MLVWFISWVVLSLLVISALISWIVFLMVNIDNSQTKYMQHFVRLGDAWSVECSIPYNKPPIWIFVRPGENYKYIYTYGKLEETMKLRYNIIFPVDGQKSILKIAKTDEDHFGQYECWPTNFYGKRQFFELNLIEYSHMNISLNANKSTTLYMDISYSSYDPIKPVFQCTFPSVKRIMEKTICDIYKNSEFVRCSLKELYEPDDDVPHICEIFLNNKLCSHENLFLNPVNELEILKKGTLWSVSCKTASSYSVKWLFTKGRTHDTSIVLYSERMANKIYSDRYCFRFSNDRRVYDMIIPHVDLDHSGTYICTHKSSDHLIERKINLVVIDKIFIDLTLNSQQLVMFISYKGIVNLLPSLVCSVNNKTINNTNITCQHSKIGLTECRLIESCEKVENIPDKCYVFLADRLFAEKDFSVDKFSLNGSETAAKMVVVFLIILMIFLASLCVVLEL